ncbi:MAG: hypothetical protein JNM07_09295 [Phycisphaerae bacterium]|nr:hypothetical protein [Phycisphaerae bacterium]
MKLDFRAGLVSFALAAGVGQTWAQTPAPAKPEAQPAVAPPAADLPSAEKVMERFIEVTGGRENYAKLKTRIVKGTFEMPAMNMKGQTTMTVGDGGRMLMVMDLPGFGVQKTGSDGTTVWDMNPMMGPRIITGPERDMMVRSSTLSEALDWKAFYTKVECVTVQDVNGKPCYEVHATDKEGRVTKTFYGKESGLAVKASATMPSQMGEMQVDMSIEDYKDVGGVLLPHKITQTMMGQQIVMATEKIEANPTIPDETFALPPEIKKLLEQPSTPPTPAPTAPGKTDPVPPGKK